VFGTWTETLVFGEAELKNIALTHAIILGIAVVRFGWARFRRRDVDAP
jgi:hypothetical protein